MDDRDVIAIAAAYWAEFFGLPPEELFSIPFRLTRHAGELRDYHGVYGLFRDGSAVVSAPLERMDEMERLLNAPSPVDSPERLAETLAGAGRVIVGPAWIGYAAKIAAAPVDGCRALEKHDDEALVVLRAACESTEWEHGGSEITQPCSGVFVDGKLVVVAGYEVWGGTIAHIAIVTHPRHRGRGYGRSAVAHLAGRALGSGLLPQYRTLVANAASMKIAEELGFERYAVSLAVRL